MSGRLPAKGDRKDRGGLRFICRAFCLAQPVWQALCGLWRRKQMDASSAGFGSGRDAGLGVR